ncbi:MAG: PAS domain S-box protein [Alphaproteobacteria bacterium]
MTKITNTMNAASQLVSAINAETSTFSSPSFDGQEIFRLAMEHSAIGMALLLPCGSWIKVNQSFCNLIGYTESELLKVDFQKITHPDDLEADIDFVNRLINGEIQTYSMEKRYVRKDGKVVWVLLTVSLVRDDENAPLYFISQIQNITTERDNQQKLISANKELEQLSFHLSHDISAPLHSAITLLELIRSATDVCDYEKSKDLLGLMENSLKKLSGLADDILSLTQISLNDEDEQYCNVSDMVNDAINMFSHLEGSESVDIVREFQLKKPISTKKFRLEVIVNNLISNAIKYQDPSKDRSVIKISTYEENGAFVISIADNGLGIDKKFRHRIFKMFERFHKSDVSGSGVGLYLVKTSADALGGRIEYQPLRGGSRFTLRLVP